MYDFSYVFDVLCFPCWLKCIFVLCLLCLCCVGLSPITIINILARVMRLNVFGNILLNCFQRRKQICVIKINRMTLFWATAHCEGFRSSNRLSVFFCKRFLLLSKSIWRVPLPIFLLFANIAQCCCSFIRKKQAKDNEIWPIRLKFSKRNITLVRVRRAVYNTRFEGIRGGGAKPFSPSPVLYVPDRSSSTHKNIFLLL